MCSCFHQLRATHIFSTLSARSLAVVGREACRGFHKRRTAWRELQPPLGDPLMRSRWIPPVLWAILIEILTSWPNPPSVGFLPAGSDKAVHLTLYAVFACLVARAAQVGRPSWRVLGMVALGLFVWGAVDEWHQIFIPGRGADAADWAADSIGVLAGLALRRAWAARPTMRTA